MWDWLFPRNEKSESEKQAEYHEEEARKCDAELRRLIGYPSIYGEAYTQTMRLIYYHREQAKMLREQTP